jgi:hypothetical protein
VRAQVQLGESRRGRVRFLQEILARYDAIEEAGRYRIGRRVGLRK